MEIAPKLDIDEEDGEPSALVEELDQKFGEDIYDIKNIIQYKKELIKEQKNLLKVGQKDDEQETNPCTPAILESEDDIKHMNELKKQANKFKEKYNLFLSKNEQFHSELTKRFTVVKELHSVLEYLKTYQKVDDLSYQLTNCNDDEQVVLLYNELKDMCAQYQNGHRSAYIREYTHYWHNVLKDKFSEEFEKAMNMVKWPFTSGQKQPPVQNDAMSFFSNICRMLFLIEEPKAVQDNTSVSDDFSQDQEASLPIKLLLKPLKKRFAFHFTASRQTARVDRPEWFLTQTLAWIKDHQDFIRKHVQTIANKIDLKHVITEDEFNAGLIQLASERLHTVLEIYQTQGLKGEMLDSDAAFAHAVDETLGFHKELVLVAGKEGDRVLSVLTRAETFVKWLAVEKKYALAKMDETLSNNQWMETVQNNSREKKAPRGADWFIALLATIEQRYDALPRPGHRLQFLELQLELIEEWRVRLTQMLSASITSLNEDSFLKLEGPHVLTAVVNTADYTRSVLLQWANSMHYLYLNHYRKQFQQFTLSQHQDEEAPMSVSDPTEDTPSPSESDTESSQSESLKKKKKPPNLSDVSSIDENENIRRNDNVASPMLNILSMEPAAPQELEQNGVFAEAPSLFAHLRDAGLNALADHMVLEFKASIRAYKKQKWHAMPVMDEMSLTISPSLCRPLGGLCSRLLSSSEQLAEPLADRLRIRVAHEIDLYIFEEVVMESWWSPGGSLQLTHDIKRNLVPAFTPSRKLSLELNPLPMLSEACTLVKMEYDDAQRIRMAISKKLPTQDSLLESKNIKNIKPKDVLQVLSQRTDLNMENEYSIRELF